MDHEHDLAKSAEKINCPICRDLSQKNKENEIVYKSPLKGKEFLMTPHRLVDGIMSICKNSDCKICHQSQGLSSNIVYHMDLPGPCPKCGDNSCCEGIERDRVFNIK